MRKQRLRGEMTFPISHTRMQPLKAETLALKEATQVLRDPRGNRWPQTGECHGCMGKAESARLIAQQPPQCPRLLPLGTELAACHSRLMDPRGGADTLPRHQSTKPTSQRCHYHKSKKASTTGVPTAGLYPDGKCSGVNSPSFSSLK